MGFYFFWKGAVAPNDAAIGKFGFGYDLEGPSHEGGGWAPVLADGRVELDEVEFGGFNLVRDVVFEG